MRRHVSALGLAAVILASAGAAGSQEPASLESPARTPDGQPDIQGVWTNLDSTPLEAASAEAWRDLDALALWFPGINAPNGRLTGPNPSPDFGGEVTARQSAVRRSMVVDPPDGAAADSAGGGRGARRPARTPDRFVAVSHAVGALHYAGRAGRRCSRPTTPAT